MTKYRLAIARLVLVLLGVALPVALLEIALRLKGYQAFHWSDKVNTQLLTVTGNAELPYVLTPNAEGWGWETQIAINSHGFRDREFDEAKGHRLRIAAIGDSITFGSRLSPPSVLYPKKLEQLIARRRPTTNTEVMNFGVTGYDVVNNVEHLRVRALRFEPDIVLLGFCVNDIGTSSTALGYIRVAKYLSNPVFRSRAAQFVLSTGLRWAATAEAGNGEDIGVFQRINRARILPIDNDPELTTQISELAKLIQGDPQPGLIEWWTQPSRIGFLEYGFRKLNTLKRRHGFEVVVVGIPILESRGRERWRLVNRIIAYESRKYGFHFVDLYDKFEKAGFRRLRNERTDEIHPSAQGHTIIANEVFAYLAQSRLLEKSAE